MSASLASCVLGAGLAFALIAMTTGIDGGSGAAPRAANQDPGRAVFARMGCGSCHGLAAAGSRGEMGPDLDQRLPAHTRASLVERITRGPAADGTFGPMPDDFRDRLDEDELDALVDFLLAARPAR